MFNASIASLVSRVWLIAQPTRALEYASRTAARYSQPSRVGMYVMSLSQRSLGCSDLKSRLMRFGDAWVLRESVVTRNRRIALGRICALRISLATVFRQHGTFWANNSTCTLGAPYDSLREICNASHRAGTPYCRRFFSTKAYFTSLPERSRWPLFLKSRSPS